MFLVQVFRPEVLPDYDRTEVYEAWENNPFYGIEILGFCESEDQVNLLIDEFQPVHPKWKFHYEPVDEEVLRRMLSANA